MAANAARAPRAHVPVLRREAMAALALKAGGLYLDATFGAGGYTEAILAEPGTRVLALDRDPRAIAEGRAFETAIDGRLTLRQSRFGAMQSAAQAVLGASEAGFDGIVFDIGVSSMQVDEAERGFSFRLDGPLDMRMEGEGPSAADIVNGAPEGELADILHHFGEERAARRIARAIVHDRAKTPFATTRALADMIARVLPGRPGDIHPATRAFQALRIAVNDELGELARALPAASRLLKAGGTLAVVSFHSLEDRIVKAYLAAASGRGEPVSRHQPIGPDRAEPSFLVPRGQPVLPQAEEVRDNPRARSARLRHGVRTAAPTLDMPPVVAALARLPAPSRRR